MPKAGIQFKKKDEWYTPKKIIDFFAPFNYDPATTPELANYFHIPHYDTIDSNGLTTNWDKYDKIWVNPPFTRKFEFLEKAVKTTAKVFFLIPIETLTTKKFHEIVKDTPYTIWLPNGRIKFSDNERERVRLPLAQLFWNLGVRTNKYTTGGYTR